MTNNNSFVNMFSDEENKNQYWTEKAIIDFSIELYHLLKIRGLSKKDFAHKINKSQAYITKVFRGDANFTIETMVSLVKALDGELTLHVTAKEDKVVNWLKVLKGGKKNPPVNQYWGKSFTAETILEPSARERINNEFAVVA